MHDWSEAERVARASCGMLNPMPCLTLVDALLGAGKAAEARVVADSIAGFVAPSPPLAARQLAVARALHDSAAIRKALADSAAMRGARPR